jgi:hypothetical protein
VLAPVLVALCAAGLVVLVGLLRRRRVTRSGIAGPGDD